MVGQLRPEALPGRLRSRQGTHPPVDCERQMMGRTVKRPLTVVIALLAALTMVIGVQGCSRAVDGSAIKAGSGSAGPRNNDSEKTYPNLLKECDVLTEDILAETVGADPLDIQSTFVGAVCRWQAANPAGLIDITRFWFSACQRQMAPTKVLWMSSGSAP